MTSPASANALPLSVVVVRFAGGDAVSRTLEMLVPQVERAGGDIVVAHRRDDAPSAALRAQYPSVRWIAGDANATPARLRSIGVGSSTGRIVACTEDHCVPMRDWAQRVLQAHVRGSAIVGGAIDKAPTPSAAAWVAYLLDYARYMSPLPGGPSAHASDCNVSYARRDLDAVRDAWSDEFHETTVQWALAARGIPVVLDPTVVVQQHRDIELGEYLRERRAHGRIYAKTRIARASAMARARFAALALLLPPVLVMRVQRVVSSRGGAVAVPPGVWTLLTRAAIAWSAGELDGYLGRR